MGLMTGFPASVSLQGLQGSAPGVIQAGGRDYVRMRGGIWTYYSGVRVITPFRKKIDLFQLPESLADFCLVITHIGPSTRLWAIGGSNVPER